MSEKIIGYTLVAIGIVIILFSAVSVFSVFTKRSKPVELFNFQSISLSPEQLAGGQLPSEAQSLLKNDDSKVQKAELIPGEMLSQSTNVFSHIFLMGFMASVGFKIASIGTQLSRPIVVKIREAKPT